MNNNNCQGGGRESSNCIELKADSPEAQALCEKKKNKGFLEAVFTYLLPKGSNFPDKSVKQITFSQEIARDMMNATQIAPTEITIQDKGKKYKISYKKFIEALGVVLIIGGVGWYFRPVDGTQEQIAQTLGDSPQTEVAQKTQANHQTTIKKQAPVQQNQSTQQATNPSSRPVEDTKVQNTETVNTEILSQDIVTPIEEYRDPFEVKVQYYVDVLQKYIDEHTDDLSKGANRSIANRTLKALQSTEIQQQRKAIQRIEDSLNGVIKLYEEDPNTLYVGFSQLGIANHAS